MAVLQGQILAMHASVTVGLTPKISRLLSGSLIVVDDNFTIDLRQKPYEVASLAKVLNNTVDSFS
jgi:hypothetical protein